MEVAAAATEHGWGRRAAQGARGLLHIAQIGAIDVQGTSTVCLAQMMLGRCVQARSSCVSISKFNIHDLLRGS